MHIGPELWHKPQKKDSGCCEDTPLSCTIKKSLCEDTPVIYLYCIKIVNTTKGIQNSSYLFILLLTNQFEISTLDSMFDDKSHEYFQLFFSSSPFISHHLWPKDLIRASDDLHGGGLTTRNHQSIAKVQLLDLTNLDLLDGPTSWEFFPAANHHMSLFLVAWVIQKRNLRYDINM